MSLVQTYEDALIEWLFGHTFPAPPAALYLALHRVTPPTQGNMIQGWGGGDRVLLQRGDFGPISDSADGHRMLANTRALMLGTHAVNQRIEGFGLWNAATAGDLIAWGRLSTPLTLSAGDPPIFMTGKLLVTAI